MTDIAVLADEHVCPEISYFDGQLLVLHTLLLELVQDSAGVLGEVYQAVFVPRVVELNEDWGESSGDLFLGKKADDG